MIRNEVIHNTEIGKFFIHTAATASTNSLAAAWLLRTDIDKQLLHGAVFVTHSQTAGRGQMGNTWHMQAGKDAAFSILLLNPTIAVTDQFYLNMAVSLAVHDALLPYTGDSLRIKWPNDIYAGDKKLGGILIENTLSGDKIAHAIVGIGLNINSVIDATLLPRATSLYALTGNTHLIPTIIRGIAHALNSRYHALMQGQYARLKEAYMPLMYKYGKLHSFTHQGAPFEAIVTGITHPGKLLLQHADGRTIAYGFKEVVWG